MNLVEKAEEFARNAHRGQFRRDGITPYITHPEKVASLLDTEEEKAVAWLHDVLEESEDQESTTDALRLEFGRILYAILMLTREPDETYEEYLDAIKDNRLLARVKIADMLANLTDSPTQKQIEKYTKGILFLVSK